LFFVYIDYFVYIDLMSVHKNITQKLRYTKKITLSLRKVRQSSVHTVPQA